jgi:hypothetical protein
MLATKLWFFALLSLTVFGAEPDRCVTCHGNSAPVSPSKAPRLAEKFSMDWKMVEFESKTRPPFTSIPKPTGVLHGSTYYDWSKKAMTEVYRDQCIDIFPSGRDNPCRFTSVGDQTHLIRYDDKTLKTVKNCCRWSSAAFWAPRPDVGSNMQEDKKMHLGSRPVKWWTLDIPLPGPFGYGFYEDETPAAFWFPVISGWVQQNFENYKPGAPGADAFVLPTACTDAPVCLESSSP